MRREGGVTWDALVDGLRQRLLEQRFIQRLGDGSVDGTWLLARMDDRLHWPTILQYAAFGGLTWDGVQGDPLWEAFEAYLQAAVAQRQHAAEAQEATAVGVEFGRLFQRDSQEEPVYPHGGDASAIADACRDAERARRDRIGLQPDVEVAVFGAESDAACAICFDDLAGRRGFRLGCCGDATFCMGCLREHTLGSMSSAVDAWATGGFPQRCTVCGVVHGGPACTNCRAPYGVRVGAPDHSASSSPHGSGADDDDADYADDDDDDGDDAALTDPSDDDSDDGMPEAAVGSDDDVDAGGPGDGAAAGPGAVGAGGAQDARRGGRRPRCGQCAACLAARTMTGRGGRPACVQVTGWTRCGQCPACVRASAMNAAGEAGARPQCPMGHRRQGIRGRPGPPARGPDVANVSPARAPGANVSPARAPVANVSPARRCGTCDGCLRASAMVGRGARPACVLRPRVIPADPHRTPTAWHRQQQQQQPQTAGQAPRPRRGEEGRAPVPDFGPPPRPRPAPMGREGPLGSFAWDVGGWRQFIRDLPEVDVHLCKLVSMDELPAECQRLYGMVETQLYDRIADVPDDGEAERLLALLPRLLLSDRRLKRVRGGQVVSTFRSRVDAVLRLRDIPSLPMWARTESTSRTRIGGARSEERTLADVLKALHLGQASRARRALMSGEVAEPTESMIAALEALGRNDPAELADLPDDVPVADTPLDRGHFMHIIGADETGRTPVGSAADAQQRRWEHIDWVVRAGGAESLYRFCNALYTGAFGQDRFTWVYVTRLVALIKDGDSEARRRLRPIGIGCIYVRIIGKCVCKMLGREFEAIFDPVIEVDVEDAALEEEDTFYPANVGVAQSAGAAQAQWTVVEALAANPTWVAVGIDDESAFNLCSRAGFLNEQRERGLHCFRWTYRCYARVTYGYIVKRDGSVHVVARTSGSTQGDPTGPVDHGLANIADIVDVQLHQIPDGVQVYYLDDGTIVGPPEQVAAVIAHLLDPESVALTGRRLNLAKSWLWHPELIERAGEESAAAAAFRERMRLVFPEAAWGMRGVRDPRQYATAAGTLDEAKYTAEVFENRGIVLLGAPICGAEDFVEAKAMAVVDRSRQFVHRAIEVLLPRFPDEFLQLMRGCLPGQFVHIAGSPVGPRRVHTAAVAFDELQRFAYSAAVGPLTSADLPAHRVVHLPVGLGAGRGYVSVERTLEPLHLGQFSIAYHRVYRRCRRFLQRSPPFEEGSGASLAEYRRLLDAGLLQREELTHSRAVAEWLVGNCRMESAVVRGPVSQLLEGTNYAGPVHDVPTLTELCSEPSRHLTRYLTGLSHAVELESILGECTPVGRATLLDQQLDAARWVRARVPRPDEERGAFQRFEPGAIIFAHQATLRLPPTGLPTGCCGCGDPLAWLDPNHLTSCAAGLRVSTCLHHPVKQVLIDMLTSIYQRRVLDGDRTGSGLMRRYSRFHRPDIVVLDFVRPGVHLLIDVKTFDSATAVRCQRDHADVVRLAAHTECERALEAQYCTEPPTGARSAVLHPRAFAIGENVLLCAAVSRLGSPGRHLSAFIKKVAALRADRVDDGLCRDFRSFEEVWRHRLSLAVQTACSSRAMALAVPAAEAALLWAQRTGHDDVGGGVGGGGAGVGGGVGGGAAGGVDDDDGGDDDDDGGGGGAGVGAGGAGVGVGGGGAAGVDDDGASIPLVDDDASIPLTAGSRSSTPASAYAAPGTDEGAGGTCTSCGHVQQPGTQCTRCGGAAEPDDGSSHFVAAEGMEPGEWRPGPRPPPRPPSDLLTSIAVPDDAVWPLARRAPCSLCHEPFAIGVSADHPSARWWVTCCGHAAHRRCLVDRLQRSQTRCPVCRRCPSCPQEADGEPCGRCRASLAPVAEEVWRSIVPPEYDDDAARDADVDPCPICLGEVDGQCWQMRCCGRPLHGVCLATALRSPAPDPASPSGVAGATSCPLCHRCLRCLLLPDGQQCDACQADGFLRIREEGQRAARRAEDEQRAVDFARIGLAIWYRWGDDRPCIRDVDLPGLARDRYSARFASLSESQQEASHDGRDVVDALLEEWCTSRALMEAAEAEAEASDERDRIAHGGAAAAATPVMAAIEAAAVAAAAADDDMPAGFPPAATTTGVRTGPQIPSDAPAPAVSPSPPACLPCRLPSPAPAPDAALPAPDPPPDPLPAPGGDPT